MGQRSCSPASISSTTWFCSDWRADIKQGTLDGHNPYPKTLLKNLAMPGLGSAELPASLTNWFKGCWRKTSRMSPPRHHATLSLAGIWGWFCPPADGSWGAGLGARRSSIRRLQTTRVWQPSPASCQEEMSCVSNHWRFSSGGSLAAFFLFCFVFSPRFQVQLQTLKCVSPLSAERGFMCGADYCMSLLSAESRLWYSFN